MFRNMTVGKRITLGFAVALALMCAVAVVGYRALRNASQAFSDYKGIADEANLAAAMEATMQRIRMAGKDYIIREGAKELEAFDGRRKELTELLNQAEEQIDHPDRSARVTKVAELNEQYYTAWKRMLALTATRNQCLKGDFQTAGPLMAARLSAIMASESQGQNARNVLNAGMAARHLLDARIDVARYLDIHDPALLTSARSKLDKLGEAVAALERDLAAPEARKHLDEIRRAQTQYLKAVDAVAAAIEQCDAIIKGDVNEAGLAMAGNLTEINRAAFADLERIEGEVLAANAAAIRIMTTAALLALAVGSALAFIITRGITKPINRIVAGLTDGADQVAAASNQVSAASQSLAQGSSEQAAAIEETSSSLEEMSSVTKQNAANAQQANGLTRETTDMVDKAQEAMQRLNRAIQDIKTSSDETAKIVKTIDEIAFQTNLLALNAAVEAARAGDAGKGFAVVAEEVRNLAQRAGEAARNTAALIEGSVKNSEQGVAVAEETGRALAEVTSSTQKVAGLVSEIAAASNEQAQGIEQVNMAVSQMDQVTQQNAANAEESASASEELNAQAEQLNNMVQQLVAMVDGSRSSADARRRAPTSPSSAPLVRRPLIPGATRNAAAATGKAQARLNAELAIPLEETEEEMARF